MKILFTVIVPMFNVAAFVNDALDSLLRQEPTGWEALLLDDGSGDETLAICREKVGSDSRFRIIPCPHDGHAGRLRNIGIREARGEYVMFLDADDEIEPGSLAYFREALARFGAIDVLGAQVCSGVKDEASNFVPRGSVANFRAADGVHSGREALASLCRQRRTLICYSCANLYRREFLLKHQLFQREDIVLQEDHEWMPRVLWEAETVGAVDFAYYRYIRHPGSITTGRHDRAAGDIAEVVVALADFFARHRSEMSVLLCRFWAAHALNSLFWYYFHPQYEAQISDEARRAGLFRLFGEATVRRHVLALFRYASPGKIAALPLLWLAGHGYFVPARLYFHRVFFRK